MLALILQDPRIKDRTARYEGTLEGLGFMDQTLGPPLALRFPCIPSQPSQKRVPPLHCFPEVMLRARWTAFEGGRELRLGTG